MTATIVLPDDHKEATLILEILKRFNVPVFKNGEAVAADYLAEHQAILNERWEEMNQPNAQFYSLDEVETLLSKRFTN
jgi:hypothetical protein